jgi:hypothetical protein
MAAPEGELMATTAADGVDAITLAEAGRRLSCRPKTLRRLYGKSKVRLVRIGREYRMPVAELERLLTEGTAAAK